MARRRKQLFKVGGSPALAATILPSPFLPKKITIKLSHWLMKRRLSGELGREAKAALLAPFRFGISERGENASPFQPFSLGEERVTESPSNPDSHQRLPPVREKQACTWQLRPDTFWPARSLPRFVLAAASLLWMQVEKRMDFAIYKNVLIARTNFRLTSPGIKGAVSLWHAGKAAQRGEARFAPSFEARAVVRAGRLACSLARSCTHKLMKKGKKRREYLHLWVGGLRGTLRTLSALNGATGQRRDATRGPTHQII